MKVKERHVQASVSSVYRTSSATYPTRPYASIVKDGFGRLVMAIPASHKSGDTVQSSYEAITESDKFRSGYRICNAVREGYTEMFAQKSASDQNILSVPHVTSQSYASAIGTGNTVPPWLQPASVGWVSTQSHETASDVDLWDRIRAIRPSFEADLYAGLSSSTDQSRYLRSVFELKDVPGTVDAYKELIQFGQVARRSGLLGKLGTSATVVEVARHYLATIFGTLPTYGDARMWCEKSLSKAPVKLVLKRPVEYGGTIRRAVTLDPNAGVRTTSEHTQNLTAFNTGWAYTAPDVTQGAIDVTPLASTVSGWQSSGLCLRPYSRRRLKGVFFGRVDKPKLIVDLEELGEEQAYYLDYTIRRNLSPVRDFLLAYHPLTTAWQLTPYSFLVDWFVNVGKTIRALETALANTKRRLSLVEGVWLSIRDERVVQYPKLTITEAVTNRLVGFSSSSFTVNQSGSVHTKVEWVDQYSGVSYSRAPVSSLLGPTPELLRDFRFDLKLSPYQLTAGAALIVTHLPVAQSLQRFLRR